MQNKLMVSIFVPYFDSTFDVFVPNNSKIGCIRKSLLFFLNNDYYSIDNDFLLNFRLIDRTSGAEYDLDSFVYDSGIVNGTKMVFI